jgi:hypothetical protein
LVVVQAQFIVGALAGEAPLAGGNPLNYVRMYGGIVEADNYWVMSKV